MKFQFGGIQSLVECLLHVIRISRYSLTQVSSLSIGMS